jgi:hypothetical protein
VKEGRWRRLSNKVIPISAPHNKGTCVHAHYILNLCPRLKVATLYAYIMEILKKMAKKS